MEQGKYEEKLVVGPGEKREMIYALPEEGTA